MNEDPTLDRSKSRFESEKEDVQGLLGVEGRPSRPDWLWDGDEDGFVFNDDMAKETRAYIEYMEQTTCDAMAVLDNMEEGEAEPFDCVNVCQHIKDALPELGYGHCKRQCYDDPPAEEDDYHERASQEHEDNLNQEPGCQLADTMGADAEEPKRRRMYAVGRAYLCEDCIVYHQPSRELSPAVFDVKCDHCGCGMVRPEEPEEEEKWICPYRERCVYFQQKRCHGQIEGFCMHDDGKPPEEALK